jgi:DNA-binding HxlR family transcriptional regulator
MSPPTGESSADAQSDEVCTVIKAVDRIGSKWRLVILYDLQDEEKRFNELKQSTGASSRTLSRVLDELQDAGFVHRRVDPEPQIATYYRLTEAGSALCPVFDAIETWSRTYLATRSDVN